MKDYLYTIWLRKKKKKESHLGRELVFMLETGCQFQFQRLGESFAHPARTLKRRNIFQRPPLPRNHPFWELWQESDHCISLGLWLPSSARSPLAIHMYQRGLCRCLDHSPTQQKRISIIDCLTSGVCLNHELGHWVVSSSSHQYATNFHLKKVGYLSTKALRSHPKSPSAPWTGWRGSWGLCGSL